MIDSRVTLAIAALAFGYVMVPLYEIVRDLYRRWSRERRRARLRPQRRK